MPSSQSALKYLFAKSFENQSDFVAPVIDLLYILSILCVLHQFCLISIVFVIDFVFFFFVNTLSINFNLNQ